LHIIEKKYTRRQERGTFKNDGMPKGLEEVNTKLYGKNIPNSCVKKWKGICELQEEFSRKSWKSKIKKLLYWEGNG
jgi:hypothetical protein